MKIYQFTLYIKLLNRSRMNSYARTEVGHYVI